MVIYFKQSHLRCTNRTVYILEILRHFQLIDISGIKTMDNFSYEIISRDRFDLILVSSVEI